MEEEGGEITLEAIAISILETLVEEVKTKAIVNQVIKKLINKKLSAITLKSIKIMHVNAERHTIIRTSNVKIRHTMQIVPPVLCLWHTLKEFL